jgi:hypothetical protein
MPLCSFGEFIAEPDNPSFDRMAGYRKPVCNGKTDILCLEPVRQGPNQSGKEKKKDWLFEEVLIAFSCPPLRLLGQESLHQYLQGM